MMDTCLVQTANRAILNSERSDMYPNVRAAIRDELEQLRHQVDAMDVAAVALVEMNATEGGHSMSQAAPKTCKPLPPLRGFRVPSVAVRGRHIALGAPFGPSRAASTRWMPA